MAGFRISSQSWETLSVDRNKYRASLSDGYSSSVTNYLAKIEKRQANRRQRRVGRSSTVGSESGA